MTIAPTLTTESSALFGRLLRCEHMMQRPCSTISLIVEMFHLHVPQFAANAGNEVCKPLLGLGDLAVRRRGTLPLGSPNKEVDKALEAISQLRKATSK